MGTDTTICLLVRHGHVEGIDPPRFRGRTELPLTGLGERQACALRDRIAAEWEPAAVYSSPMGRCLRTADILAQPLDLAVEPVPNLNDLDYGEWQGLSHDEVHRRWPEEYARWRRTPHLVAMPQGESLRELGVRATRALHDILHRHRGQTVIVTGHDSVNRVLLLHALELPLARYRSIAQSPCALNVLQHDGGRFVIRTINETGHLLAT
jgi:broad specificity phosphatase PhoE